MLFNNGQLQFIRNLQQSMQLVRPLRWAFAVRPKIYYPFFLASDYTPLTYSPYYGQKASHLVIDKANLHQINYTTLPQFLTAQLEEDKTLFRKEKELMFVGRSNAGKSSLINQIFNTVKKRGKRKIAWVAKRPGTTKFLHFHHMKNQDSLLVDAPGYGYARMNKRRRQMWFGLTEQYMKISSRLSQIFLCINLEHGVKSTDLQFIKRCSRYNIDIQIIITKVDRVSPGKYFHALRAIVETIKRLEIPRVNQRVIAVSTKKKFGIEIVRMRIAEAIENSQQRNIDHQEDLLLDYVKELRVQRVRLQQPQKQQSKEFVVRKLIYQSKLTKFLK